MPEFGSLLRALDKRTIAAAWTRSPIAHSVEPLRAIPSSDGTAAVFYLVRSERRQSLVAGRWYSEDLALPSPRPGQTLLESARVLLVPPETDGDIPGLADALDPRRLDRVVGKPRFRPRRATLLAHRPGKRAAIRIDGDDDGRKQVLFAKALRPRKVADAANRLRDARASGLARARGTRVPRLVGVDERRGILFIEWVDAPALHQRLDSRDVSGAVERVGRALRSLHDTTLGGLVPHDAQSERDLVAFWLRVIVDVDPQHGAEARRLARCLEGALVDGHSDSFRTSHRDFHDKQVLVGEKRVTIVDVDSFAFAEPALDRGNFVAHLELREAQGRLSRGSSGPLAASFLRGYGLRERGARDARYTAAALFRLAGLYALRPAHRHLASPLLALSRRAHEEFGRLPRAAGSPRHPSMTRVSKPAHRRA